MTPESLILAGVAVLIGLVVLYLVLAAALTTSWKLDDAGLTLRSAAVLGARICIPWSDVVSIGFGTTFVYHTTLESMNLDGRIIAQRHVTLVRRSKRAVQFTPRDIADFERQLQRDLGSKSDWSHHESCWHHSAPPIATGR